MKGTLNFVRINESSKKVTVVKGQNCLKIKVSLFGIPGFLDSGRWTLDTGLWMLDPGLWTLDSEPWTLNSRRWAPDIER